MTDKVQSTDRELKARKNIHARARRAQKVKYLKSNVIEKQIL